MFAAITPLTSYAHVIAKENLYLSISGYVARDRQGIDWIKEIFKTIDLEYSD